MHAVVDANECGHRTAVDMPAKAGIHWRLRWGIGAMDSDFRRNDDGANFVVTPTEVGVQGRRAGPCLVTLDSGLRRNDEWSGTGGPSLVPECFHFPGMSSLHGNRTSQDPSAHQQPGGVRGRCPAHELHPRRARAGGDPVGRQPPDPASRGPSGHCAVPAPVARAGAHARRRAVAPGSGHGARTHRQRGRRSAPQPRPP